MSQSIPNASGSGLPKTLGALLVVLGGAFTVGAGVYVMQEPTPLWGLFFVLWMLEELCRDKPSDNWQPVRTGLIMFVAAVLLGVAVLYLHTAGPVWGLILVPWMADALD